MDLWKESLILFFNERSQVCSRFGESSDKSERETQSKFDLEIIVNE